MIVKCSTPGQKEDIFFLPGTESFALFCLQHTPRTSQTAIVMAPLAGKHGWNEDELGTQLVHVAFAEKPYAKYFEV